MDASGKIQVESELYQRLARMTAEGEPGVLATVIATQLSTPRHTGSKMIIHPDGSVTGSIGGGKAEAVVMAEARKVLNDGLCRRLDLDLAGELGVCGGQMEVFLEPVLRTTPFVVVGAGHVGRAVVQLGLNLSFRFTVVDDRPDFLAELQNLPGVRTLALGPTELAQALTPDSRTAVLVASRNHELDARYLKALLDAENQADSRFGFLGVLGSRSKAARLRQDLAGQGQNHADRLASVQLPVGLDIGSETPAEIALSVMAEALAVLRGVEFLKDDKGRELGLRLHRRREKGSGK